MRTPGIIRQVEAYWEGLRPYGDLPQRDQIDPRGLDSALDFAFLLERSHTGEPVFKLGGERLGDILGIPLERVPMVALFSQSLQPAVNSAVTSVLDEPSLLRAELTSERGVMRPEVDAHLLLLPLKDGEGHIAQALGVLHFDDAIGRSPRQFTRFSHNLTRLVLSAAPAPQIPAPQPLGMAEQMSEFVYENGRPDTSGRPKLKVIKGGLS